MTINQFKKIAVRPEELKSLYWKRKNLLYKKNRSIEEKIQLNIISKMIKKGIKKLQKKEREKMF